MWIAKKLVSIPSCIDLDQQRETKRIQSFRGNDKIMRHEHSKAIFNYWNTLRGKRPAPDRRDIEPSDIRDILGDTFILEVNETYKSISFRLAGTRICNSYGRELKGIGFLALWEEADNFAIYKAVRNVHEEMQPCTISYIAQSQANSFVEYELILLPLYNSETTTKRILGISVPISHTVWNGNDPLLNNRVKSIRPLEIETDSETPDMTTPMATDNLQTETRRRVGHLTIIQGGLG